MLHVRLAMARPASANSRPSTSLSTTAEASDPLSSVAAPCLQAQVGELEPAPALLLYRAFMRAAPVIAPSLLNVCMGLGMAFRPLTLEC